MTKSVATIASDSTREICICQGMTANTNALRRAIVVGKSEVRIPNNISPQRRRYRLALKEDERQAPKVQKFLRTELSYRYRVAASSLRRIQMKEETTFRIRLSRLKEASM